MGNSKDEQKKYKTVSEFLKSRDRGLNYHQALHGVQSAIAAAINSSDYRAVQPKHLRVGIDMSKSDLMGLAALLIDKGIITREEYEESLRLAANSELAEWEEQTGITFR